MRGALRLPNHLRDVVFRHRDDFTLCHLFAINLHELGHFTACSGFLINFTLKV